MLDRYFSMPETLDRIRSSWIAELVERYVAWLVEGGFASRTICRRVPVTIRFGEFARQQGALAAIDLPAHVDAFVTHWIEERAEQKSDHRRKLVAKEVRGPIEQMLRITLSDYAGRGRQHRPENPFQSQAPGFFDYLRNERGLRAASIRHYTHHLREFSRYLEKIGLDELGHLSPAVLSGFVIDLQPHVAWASMRNACGVLRVLLRYAFRQGIIAKDLSPSVEVPHPRKRRENTSAREDRIVAAHDQGTIVSGGTDRTAPAWRGERDIVVLRGATRQPRHRPAIRGHDQR